MPLFAGGRGERKATRIAGIWRGAATRSMTVAPQSVGRGTSLLQLHGKRAEREGNFRHQRSPGGIFRKENFDGQIRRRALDRRQHAVRIHALLAELDQLRARKFYAHRVSRSEKYVLLRRNAAVR